MQSGVRGASLGPWDGLRRMRIRLVGHSGETGKRCPKILIFEKPIGKGFYAWEVWTAPGGDECRPVGRKFVVLVLMSPISRADLKGNFMHGGVWAQGEIRGGKKGEREACW